VFNISNQSVENNPRSWTVQPTGPPYNWVAQPGGRAVDTWTRAEDDAELAAPGARVWAFVKTTWEVLADSVADLPRRGCDRLFRANDTEARWRGWQITRVRGGLGRVYRDPRFDTLSEKH
jgi:hypothetical protein